MPAWSTRFTDRWQDFRRHLGILRHLTPARGFNLAVNLLCAALRTQRVPGYPYVLRLDPTNICNFQCPLCPTGQRHYGRPPQFMPWATYVRALDQLAPWILRVWFYIWGEPLLHPQLPAMIRHAAARNLSTNLSTNLSPLTPTLADELVGSGLEYLIASIDGADAVTYARYRRGGDFARAIDQVRLLLATRRRLGSRTPFVEIQCLVTSDTEDRLAEVAALGRDLGVDRVRFMPLAIPFFPYRGQDFSSFAAWLPRRPESAHYTYSPGQPANDGPCFWLYEGLTLHPDGGISPCCRAYEHSDDFGHLDDGPLRRVFNNARFRAARALFRRRPAAGRRDRTAPPAGPAPADRLVCHGCREFRQAE